VGACEVALLVSFGAVLKSAAENGTERAQGTRAAEGLGPIGQLVNVPLGGERPVRERPPAQIRTVLSRGWYSAWRRPEDQTKATLVVFDSASNTLVCTRH